jgi:hypothetical protein
VRGEEEERNRKREEEGFCPRKNTKKREKGKKARLCN